MHKIFFLFLTAFALSSCLKNDDKEPLIIIEPPHDTFITARDTITSGEKWGLKIGDTPEELYAAIQKLKKEQKVSYLSITGNIFTSLEDIQNIIPLYSSILFDRTVGTSTGVQVYFAEDKVKSIYLNSGQQLQKWPNNTPNNSTIFVNENTATLYERLINIQKISAYQKSLERISLFEKNIDKAYDENMSNSKLWYFTTPVNDNTFYEVHLNFNEGKLLSLHVNTWEIRRI